MSIVGETINGIDAIDMAEVLRSDVVLMDPQMPEMETDSGCPRDVDRCKVDLSI